MLYSCGSFLSKITLSLLCIVVHVPYVSINIKSCGIKVIGRNNGHVREIDEILNGAFVNLGAKQLKAFESSPKNDSFLINLNGLSDELSDIGLKYATKEIRIKSKDKI